LAAALVLLGSSGCQARTTADAIQTAVVVAQAAATQVTTSLPDPQSVLPNLQFLLAGAAVQVTTTPADAAKEEVTEVTIDGADTSGALTQLEPRARQAAAGAALLAAAQYYPNATISLSVVDGSGVPLVKATKSPGGIPQFQ
jgi:hypothetical protein